MRWKIFSCAAMLAATPLVSGLLLAQTSQVPPTDAAADALAEARTVSKELTAELRRLLTEELAKGSFANALRVCSEKAQSASGAFNAARGASARRVSLRYRNPLDRPDPYEEKILHQWETLQLEKQVPAESADLLTDATGRRHLRFLQPIFVQPMCLTCHGAPEAIPPEVKSMLGSRYPKDLATGYKVGDLRGAVSVRIPLDD